MPTAVDAAEMPTLDRLTATRQRPLFSSTRRPPPEERPRQTADALRPQQPNVTLNAIILGSGIQMALLKRGRDTKAFPVTMGTEVDGWLVTKIAPNHVVLANDAQSVTLEFLKRANAPVPLPAGPTRRAELTR
ncbi:hypothetical protein [Tardiphaga sp.]|uniref:hypothetical protein n=1 Tax=Tardiphaga sp. TaxID=1926292 RepID=UPI00352B8C75